MIHSTTVALQPEDILTRAKRFFADRVPASSAFLEKEGAGFVVLRGQGGEEIVIRAAAGDGGSTVRASTLFFDQALDRFLTTLPLSSPVVVA